MMKYLYTITIILGFACTAYSIRCHVCNSVDLPDCKDTFAAKETYAVDCNSVENPMKALTFGKVPDLLNKPAKGCLKFKIQNAGVVVTSRTCYFGEISESEESCKQSKTIFKDTQVSCDVCAKDLCNSSSTTGIFAATVMCLVVLVRMMS